MLDLYIDVTYSNILSMQLVCFTLWCDLILLPVSYSLLLNCLLSTLVTDQTLGMIHTAFIPISN